MMKRLIRAGATVVATVIAAGTMTAGSASAERPVGPDFPDLMAASWYRVTPEGKSVEPTKQFKVEKVVSTSGFSWDGDVNTDDWWVPTIVVGDGVPATARHRGMWPGMTHNTSVIAQQRLSGNRYKLTVPGAVLEALLEPRAGW